MNIPKLGLAIPLMGLSMAYAQTVNEDGSVTVTFPVELVAKCHSQGGCALVTMAEMANFRAEVVKEYCSKGI